MEGVKLSVPRFYMPSLSLEAMSADKTPHPGFPVDDAICKRRQRIKVCPADIAVPHLAEPVDRFASVHIAPT